MKLKKTGQIQLGDCCDWVVEGVGSARGHYDERADKMSLAFRVWGFPEVLITRECSAIQPGFFCLADKLSEQQREAGLAVRVNVRLINS